VKDPAAPRLPPNLRATRLLALAFGLLVLLAALPWVVPALAEPGRPGAAARPDRAGPALAALAAAVLLALLVAGYAVRSLVRALRGLTDTLDRLTGGDHGARAAEGGPAEVAALARRVNAFAEEAEQMRRVGEEGGRLRAAAREVGVRIRESLDVNAVVSQTVLALGPALDTDHLFVRLMEADRLGPAVDWRIGQAVPAHDRRTRNRAGSALEAMADRRLPGGPADWLRELYTAGRSWHTDDLSRHSDGCPAGDRNALLALGAIGVLITPVGAGRDLLGSLTLVRTRPGHPWLPLEVEAVEWVAADLGRGLRQARLYEQERRVSAELRSLNQARTDFLFTVSHELRTPLTSITGYVEMLREGDAGALSPRQDQMLETVERNAARLRGLIEDLLTLSRIEMGAFKTVKQPVDLRALVTGAVAAIEPAAVHGELSLEVESPTRPLIVDGDGNQLDRVLMNLLSNAVKFTPAGGRIRVRAEADAELAVVSVADTGIGIPAEEQKTLFTRWFRASNATERSIPGTGLGLTIVRTVVANHGGRLDVSSTEGAGTTVTVKLPLHADGGPGTDLPGSRVAAG
jgi:signal transduction histidine kinase